MTTARVIVTTARVMGVLTVFAGGLAMQFEIPRAAQFGLAFEEQGAVERRLALVGAVILAVNIAAWNRALWTRTAARLGAALLSLAAVFVGLPGLAAGYVFDELGSRGAIGDYAGMDAEYFTGFAVLVLIVVGANIAVWSSPSTRPVLRRALAVLLVLPALLGAIMVVGDAQAFQRCIKPSCTSPAIFFLILLVYCASVVLITRGVWRATSSARQVDN